MKDNKIKFNEFYLACGLKKIHEQEDFENVYTVFSNGVIEVHYYWDADGEGSEAYYLKDSKTGEYLLPSKKDPEDFSDWLNFVETL